MLFAAREAGLDFIVNVVIDENKNIAGAFAGHFEKAHSAGCEYLRKLSRITVPPSDIVITSNGGYPLDQNIYQAVKGMTAAEAAVRRGGVIIMCAACGDGHGGQSFYDNMSEATSPPELLKRVSGVPREKTASDQWEFQILARILTKARVIIVTGECPPEMITSMHMEHAYGIQEALDKALKMKGPDAEISVIPDGVSVVTQSTENKRGKKWV
jgi:nickel-dependent lactate racemase